MGKERPNCIKVDKSKVVGKVFTNDLSWGNTLSLSNLRFQRRMKLLARISESSLCEVLATSVPQSRHSAMIPP
jgi:hypothetical protein